MTMRGNSLVNYAAGIAVPDWTTPTLWTYSGSAVAAPKVLGSGTPGFAAAVTAASGGVWAVTYSGVLWEVPTVSNPVAHLLTSGELYVACAFAGSGIYALNSSGVVRNVANLAVGTFGVPGISLVSSGSTLFTPIPTLSGVGTMAVPAGTTGLISFSAVMATPTCIAAASSGNRLVLGGFGITPYLSGAAATDLNLADPTRVIGVGTGRAILWTTSRGAMSDAWTQGQVVTGAATLTDVVWTPAGTQALATSPASGAIQVFNYSAGILSLAQTLTVSAAVSIAAGSSTNVLIAQSGLARVAFASAALGVWTSGIALTGLTGAVAVTTYAPASAAVAIAYSGGLALTALGSGGTWVAPTIVPLSFAPTLLTADNFGQIYAVASGFMAVVSNGVVVGSGTLPAGTPTGLAIQQGRLCVAMPSVSAIYLMGLTAPSVWTQMGSAALALGATVGLGLSQSTLFVLGSGSTVTYGFSGSPYTLTPVRIGTVSQWTGAAWVTTAMGPGRTPSAVNFDASGIAWVATVQNDLWGLSAAGTVLTSGVVPQQPGQSQTVPLGVSSLIVASGQVFAATSMAGMLINTGVSGTTVPFTESAPGTIVTNNISTIVNSINEQWSLVVTPSSGNRVAVNGVADTTTSQVIELYYDNSHQVWREEASGLWWAKAVASGAWLPVSGTLVSPIPGFTESPSGTVVTGSVLSITNSVGQIWKIVTSPTLSGQVAVDTGTGLIVDPTTSTVIELYYDANHRVWQENAALLWRYKTVASDTWLPSGGTSVNPTFTESSSGTVVTGNVLTITNNIGQVWKISPTVSGQVSVDTGSGFVVDSTTSGIIELYYDSSDRVWKENSSLFWQYKSVASDTWTPVGGTMVGPVFTESPSGTTVTGNVAVITNSVGQVWKIVPTVSGQIAVDTGAGFVTDTITQQVVELYYDASHRVWQENALVPPLWFYKTVASDSWLPAGGTTTSPVGFAESPSGTTVTGNVLTITSSIGEVWKIAPTVSGQVAVNTGSGFVTDTITQQVIELYYDAGRLIWQENALLLWWYKSVSSDTWLPVGGTSISPVTLPPPPSGFVSDASGVVMRRTYDVWTGWGSVLFPNGQDGSSSIGTNSAAAHITALNSIWSGTGYAPLCRVYCETFSPSNMIAFLRAVQAGVPGFKVTLTFVPRTGVANLQAVLADSVNSGLNYVSHVEGTNEPNNTQGLGTGPTTPQESADDQTTVFNDPHTAGLPVMTPSVADNVGDPNFIQDYFTGSTLNQIRANSNIANIHNYPNSGGGAHEMQARTQGISQIYNGYRPATTEYHPLLYNFYGGPQQTDVNLGAIWTAIYKLSSYYEFNHQILEWFCHYDYGWDFAQPFYAIPVGLFKNYNQNAPTQSALLMRALMRICADTGAGKTTFAPRKLNITSTGLPSGVNQYAGGKIRVMQRSDGTAFAIITNEQDFFSGTTSPVTITFVEGPKSLVRLYAPCYPITGNPVIANSFNNSSSVSLTLRWPDIQVLEIHP